MKLPHDMMAQMRAATSKLMGSGPQAATAVIQNALSAAGLMPAGAAAPHATTPQERPMHDINPPPAQAKAAQPEPEATQEQAQAAPVAPSPAQAAQEFAQDFLARLGVPAGLGQHSFDMPSFEMPNFQPSGIPGFGGAAATRAPLPEGGTRFIE